MPKFIEYLTELNIPSYKICMQCTDSTIDGIILSCLLKQMIIKQEADGVIVHDKIITKNYINQSELRLFQENPPLYIKTTIIAPGICQYTIDMDYLLTKFKKSII